MISIADVLSRQYAALNATGAADLVFWLETDFYEWASEALRHLATLAPLFIDRDTTITIQAGVPVYTNPARHITLLHVAVAGESLSPSSTRELAALSSTWLTDTGAPEQWIADWLGEANVRVYPTPTTTGAALQIVLSRFPGDVTVGAPTVSAPAIVGDYVGLRILAEARRKEGDGALPEIAAHLDQRCALLEQAYQHYWGTA